MPEQGLADLDAKIREELSLCGQLRRRAAAHRQRTQQLQGQVAEAKEQLFQHQSEHNDLQVLHVCLREQTQYASRRKKALQDSIAQLQKEVSDLVEEFEGQSDSFCATFKKCRLDEQELLIQQQEQAAELELKSSLNLLHAKRQQLGQKRSQVEGLQQKIGYTKSNIQGLKFEIATESGVSNDLMLELEKAQHEGPAAKRLSDMRHELSQREEEIINQQCSITAQEVEMGRAEADVKQRQQELARKKTELADLNKTIRALGLSPVEQTTSFPTKATIPAALPEPRAASAAAPANHQPRIGGLQFSATICKGSAATYCGTLTDIAVASIGQPQLQNHNSNSSSQHVNVQQQQQQQQRDQQQTGQQIIANKLQAKCPQQQQQPRRQLQPQQQYYVEEPDEPGQSNGLLDYATHSQLSAAAAVNARDTIKEVNPAGTCPSTVDAAHYTGNKLQLAHVTTSSSCPTAATATAEEKRPRARMVVSKTIVTQTVQQNTVGAPGHVMQKRLLIQEVEGSMPRLVANQRTVLIRETQQDLSLLDRNTLPIPQVHTAPGVKQTPKYSHAPSESTTLADSDVTKHLDGGIAGPALQAFTLCSSSTAVGVYAAGMSQAILQHSGPHVAAQPRGLAMVAVGKHQPVPKGFNGQFQQQNQQLHRYDHHAPSSAQPVLHSAPRFSPLNVSMSGQAMRNQYKQISSLTGTIASMEAPHKQQQSQPLQQQHALSTGSRQLSKLQQHCGKQQQIWWHNTSNVDQQPNSIQLGTSDGVRNDVPSVTTSHEAAPRCKPRSRKGSGSKAGKVRKISRGALTPPTCTLEGDDGFGNGNDW